jgi:hypothetical protein
MQRGTQKVSKVCIAISAIVWISAIVCLGIAWRKSDWLWLIDVFRYVVSALVENLSSFDYFNIYLYG